MCIYTYIYIYICIYTHTHTRADIYYKEQALLDKVGGAVNLVDGVDLAQKSHDVLLQTTISKVEDSPSRSTSFLVAWGKLSMPWASSVCILLFATPNINSKSAKRSSSFGPFIMSKNHAPEDLVQRMITSEHDLHQKANTVPRPNAQAVCFC